MGERIQRDAPELIRRIVPLSASHPRMRHFVHYDGENEDGEEAQEDHGRKVPVGMSGVYPRPLLGQGATQAGSRWFLMTPAH